VTKLKLLGRIAAIVALGAACGGDGPTGPVAGPIELVLASPNSDDGAVLLTVSGGPMDSVAAVGYTTFSAPLSGTSAKVVVVGSVVSGTVARVWVPDRSKTAQYSVTLVEVAARGSYQLRPLQGYRVTIQ